MTNSVEGESNLAKAFRRCWENAPNKNSKLVEVHPKPNLSFASRVTMTQHCKYEEFERIICGIKYDGYKIFAIIGMHALRVELYLLKNKSHQIIIDNICTNGTTVNMVEAFVKLHITK